MTETMAKRRIDLMPAGVMKVINGLEEHMRKHMMSIDEFFKIMDKDNNGKLDKPEFVAKIGQLKLPGVMQSDLGSAFDHLDLNDDGDLTNHEFGLYLKGAV